MESWSEHSRFVISLLALIGPWSVMPVFLGMTTHLSPRERMTAATVASITLFVVLVGGYFIGEPLISALGSSIASFQIAGGIIIGLSGFYMLNNPAVASSAVSDTGEHPSAFAIGVVPIGIPLLGGPGSLTAVMLEGHGHFSITHENIVLAAILTCVVITWLALVFAANITRVIGAIGLTIFQRAFGLIVISVGVEVIARGIRAHVQDFIGTG